VEKTLSCLKWCHGGVFRRESGSTGIASYGSRCRSSRSCPLTSFPRADQPPAVYASHAAKAETGEGLTVRHLSRRQDESTESPASGGVIGRCCPKHLADVLNDVAGDITADVFLQCRLCSELDRDLSVTRAGFQGRLLPHPRPQLPHAGTCFGQERALRPESARRDHKYRCR
jgi:hypothetical protein